MFKHQIISKTRNKLGLSQSDLSKITGIRVDMLSRLENGKQINPTLRNNGTACPRATNICGRTRRRKYHHPIKRGGTQAKKKNKAGIIMSKFIKYLTPVDSLRKKVVN